MIKVNLKICYSFCFIFLLFIAGIFVFGGDINLNAGSIYYTVLESNMGTLNWAGIELKTNTYIPDSAFPILTPISLETSNVIGLEVGGIEDDAHYYAIMSDTVFDITKIAVIEQSDVESGGLFSNNGYAQFDSNYYDFNDNPFNTFCKSDFCDVVDLMIDGINYSAIKMELGVNLGSDTRDYFLLKYNSDSGAIPLYISPLIETPCYYSNLNSDCHSEFMLPVSDTVENNLFLLSKYPAYDLTVSIDSVENLIFPQTAVPYMVGVIVKGLYDNSLKVDLDVAIAELGGYNLFMPLDTSSSRSLTQTRGVTDSNGECEFLIAPTKNTKNKNYYDIFAGVIYNDLIISREYMIVNGFEDFDRLIGSISPSSLKDNSAASLAAMDQIATNLILAADREKGLKVFVKYYLNNDTYTIKNSGGDVIQLRSGIPNIIELKVYSGSTLRSGYSGSLLESQGYLLFGPSTVGVNQAGDRLHDNDLVNNKLVVVPTSYGPLQSTINLTIFNNLNEPVGSVNFDIFNELEYEGTNLDYYSNDDIKDFATTLSQMDINIFTSLN